MAAVWCLPHPKAANGRAVSRIANHGVEHLWPCRGVLVGAVRLCELSASSERGSPGAEHCEGAAEQRGKPANEGGVDSGVHDRC
jgi:hypothetical protein